MFFVKQSIGKISKSEELFSKAKYIQASIRKYATINSAEEKQDKEVNHFRTLRIFPMKKKAKKAMQIKNNNPPRTDLMKTDQDWPNVWPGPRTFHPAVVPLPVRQGANQKRPPPGKFVNTELMKIPNFLHLTPLAIERHCNAIKKFCTKWPEDLKREEDMAKHFPVEIITTDYCHSSPTIRDPMARIVSLRIRLKSLDLDEHAKDKFLRLVGPRYDPETGIVTITTDTCPRRYQNYDYAHYLLTALYYESWKYEDWEKDRVDEDQETYFWENRNSKKSVEEMFKYNGREVPDTSQFAQAMEKLMNEEECLANVEQYKEAALKLLSLPELKEEDSLAS